LCEFFYWPSIRVNGMFFLPEKSFFFAFNQ